MKEPLHPDNLDHQQLADKVLTENGVLISKINKALTVGEEEVTAALTEVIRFLNLIAFTGQVLTPAHAIDLVWHEFILCTRAYHDFCEKTFGRMIHHTPGGDQQTNRMQFKKTLKFYDQFFGIPDQKFWGNASFLDDKEARGSCEAST